MINKTIIILFKAHFPKQLSYANASLCPQHTLVLYFLMLPGFLLSPYLRHFCLGLFRLAAQKNVKFDTNIPLMPYKVSKHV